MSLNESTYSSNLITIFILFLTSALIGYQTFSKNKFLNNSSIDSIISHTKSSFSNDDDAAQSTSKNQKLEFVHITKTGGSIIEKQASIANITWGACHYIVMQPEDQFGVGCKNPDKTLDRRVRGYDKTKVPFEFKGSLGEPWHAPPHWLLDLPYEGKKTFTVVRDPYSRMISHFYCNFKGYKGIHECEAVEDCERTEEEMNDGAIMNAWLQELLNTNKTHLAHFLPQHHYVFDKDGSRVIDHVLKQENLETEFASLMDEYDLNITLPKTKFNSRSGSSSLSVKDLNKDTIVLINDVYSDDFARFNFTLKSKDFARFNFTMEKNTSI
mmetsp:Transcript_30037/g.34907  ORF Transcript_30037/g.34907 Transcript_30037/m.34907 type:complete len:326 (+) Transcript_30037:49-1026(+)